MQTTWLEINKQALFKNLAIFRRVLKPNTKIMAIVKGFAYGHDPKIIAFAAEKWGVDYLGVNSLEEAQELRQFGVHSRILVLGNISPDAYDLLPFLDLSITFYNDGHLDLLAQAYERYNMGQKEGQKVAKARIHIKVETGLNRQGLAPEKALELMKKAEKLGIIVEGAHTHFANIEDTTEHSYGEKQLAIFSSFAEKAKKAHPEMILHTACSAAALLFPETHFDMVRVGIAAYGLWPSKETMMTALMAGKNPHPLEPVLSWKAKIAQVKPVFVGDRVGYGCAHLVTRDGLVAIIPVGYYEGYPRNLSGRASVLIGGKRCPVVGRICMNMMMADVSHISGVKAQDEVVLIGKQGDEWIKAEELASLSGTINYDIVTGINPLLKRIEVEK